MPNVRKGAAAAKADSDAAKAARGRSRIEQKTLKKGEIILVRFLSEHEPRADYPLSVISAKTHNFMDTKPQPAAFKGDNWPKAMWGVCQNIDWFLALDAAGNPTGEFEEGYGNCYIHNHFRGQKDNFGKDKSIPGDQVYGLAVLCEPQIDPVSNQVVDVKDLYHDWKDAEGTAHKIPQIVYFSQKYSNFWAGAVATAYLNPRTILGKIFRIERVENDYTVTVAGHTPTHQPGTPAWDGYMDALRIMDFDLERFLLEHASPDHYARWFDPDREPKDGYSRREDSDSDSAGESESPAVVATTASAPQFDQSLMADFQNQLSTRGKPATGTTEPAAAS